jgi:hypothetical protein
MTLTSSSFPPGDFVPRRYAGKGVGDNVSPPLAWTGVPAGTAELVLVMEDPGAPFPRPLVHLLVTAIPPSSSSFAEGRFSGADVLAIQDGAAVAKNTFGKRSYLGPRPVPGHGPHTYVFQLFALSRRLTFPKPPSRKQVVAQMRGAVIGRGRLEGRYERA